MDTASTETCREPDRPPIAIDETVYDRLRRLATAAQARTPDVAAALLEELERAEIVAATAMPHGVITIGSTLAYCEFPSGQERTVQLVYPSEADIAQGRVSVLTPIGAALIGLREGHEMTWHTRDGTERRLRIVRVHPPQVGGAGARG